LQANIFSAGEWLMERSYLSQRMSRIKPSGIRKFFDIAATMKDVISLGIGEPDFTTPEPILKAGIKSLEHGETHYTSNMGIMELRKALSNHLYKMYGVSYDPETEIVITVGGSEALNLAAIALLDPGDEVLIPTPCFVSYQSAVISAGGIPVEIPCKMENNFDIDPKEFRKAITLETKAMLIGFPNNPTGAVATRQSLQEIAKIAEEYDLIVISDEIYDRLVYDVDHVCFPSIPETRKRTLLLGGFSKDYAMTGWRIGYACGPKEILRGLLGVHQYMVMSAPTAAQYAALEALLNGETYVLQMKNEYDRRRRLMVDGFNQIGIPTFEPKGAFYTFPHVAVTGMDDETFCNKLLKEEHVAVVPGNAFGLGGEGFARACYATDYAQIEEALKRIDRFVHRQ
jgi:aminotransferase